MSNASGISAGRLYRILDFSRAVQIFETESLYFAHPQVWDDPYEARVEHQSSHALFAQCWCQQGVSDAIWRIYSLNHMGVRISTSAKKLSDAVRATTRPLGYGWEAGPVKYLSQYNLNQNIREITDSLQKKFDLATAVKLLYRKREAFTHESEWRATIYCPDVDRTRVQKGFSVTVNPHKVIDSILLDPRTLERCYAKLGLDQPCATQSGSGIPDQPGRGALGCLTRNLTNYVDKRRKCKNPERIRT